MADGDPAIWSALERKVLIGFYVSEPELILVVGHEADDPGIDAKDRRNELRRIVRRIRPLVLPAVTVGVWVNGDGTYQAVPGAGLGDSPKTCAGRDFEAAAS